MGRPLPTNDRPSRVHHSRSGRTGVASVPEWATNARIQCHRNPLTVNRPPGRAGCVLSARRHRGEIHTPRIILGAINRPDDWHLIQPLVAHPESSTFPSFSALKPGVTGTGTEPNSRTRGACGAIRPLMGPGGPIPRVEPHGTQRVGASRLGSPTRNPEATSVVVATGRPG